jgi:hypothetical protein
LVKNTGAHLVIAGPELLGEGPRQLKSSWKAKTPEYFDMYITMTRNAALSVEGV